MNIEIPNSLGALSSAVAQGNPVEIAGFGRESTHKGYLSWVLENEPPSNAAALLARLASASEELSHEGAGTQDTERVRCWQEQKLGGRKLDLRARVLGPTGSCRDYAIELKTDSGPSGGNQFTDMSQGADGFAGCIALLLGTAHVQDFDCGWGRFVGLGPKSILGALRVLDVKRTAALNDWAEAIGFEVSRYELADEVYAEHRRTKKNEPWRRYGYRSLKHLMYYVLHRFRPHLAASGLFEERTWRLYDGGFNTVLNLGYHDEQEADYWIPLTGDWQDLGVYFEFNNSVFVMKIWTRGKERYDRARACVDYLRGQVRMMEEQRGACLRADLDARRRAGKSMTVATWPINLADPSSAVRTVRQVLALHASDTIGRRI